ncbi:hypothetical protein ACFPME_17475 [Rhodanobacter umsongensis]|uniref:DUF883 domain-containing protein n=1 Tax=Rhodanobacter umsongensis TaxID=633153 RepID=A0ABW0JQZ8_9GAMM
MSVFEQLTRVKAAQRRTAAARQTLRPPVTALLRRGHTHPLTAVGAAAGAGFVLGSLNVHPLHVPGVGPLLSGGLADAVAFGARLVAELGVVGAAVDRGAPDRRADDVATSDGGPA